MNVDRMAKACAIAARLSEPKRAADVHRFHQAIIRALNGIHDARGEQDSLALMDAIAHTLAQLLGGVDDVDARRGYLEFVVQRAEWLSDAYRQEGNTAQWREVLG